MSAARALVPLKDLVQAKTRLAGLLRPSERRALAQAMVEDVLAVLSFHPNIEQVTLVSDDPCAGLLAAKYGIDCWSEKSLGCHGLNAVVRRASERLLRESAQPLLVLHGDLPLLCAADITAVLDLRQQSGGLVIACDLRGTGTNLLAFNRSSMPQFCFGTDSCAAHLAAARRAGIPARVLHRTGTATDVDDVRDMAILMAALARDSAAPAAETAALLRGTGLGARIELALETLVGGAPESGTGEAG